MNSFHISYDNNYVLSRFDSFFEQKLIELFWINYFFFLISFFDLSWTYKFKNFEGKVRFPSSPKTSIVKLFKLF